ncbi:coiled-coil domain-containing protein 154 isoform X3 [Saimiri boliviensis]|uniref:coiled-coil domain-containing protein 154 isoform X3 n=1 Tax=Saimiri boliviensis TaxID=27679 RepID=UPI003D7825B2
MSEPADNSPSGPSAPSQPSTVTLEDLGPLLAGDLASPEPSSLEELSERYESSHPTSTASVPEQDAAKRWRQLEQWVVELQAEGARLREHRRRCERATRSLLGALLQVRARLELQGSELRQLRQEVWPAAQAPEKEAQEFSGLQNQMQALDKRLVEIREALSQLRRRQAQLEAERKGAEQEAGLRLAKLTDLLRQEEEGREVACSALRKDQEDSSRRMDLEVARMEAQMTRLGEEVSLRFLKREAKLCGFLQKSFLALEKRMRASESSRLRLEGSLRGELESRWEKLQGLMEERLRALQGQSEQESHLLEQCQGLDAAVAQLTKFVQQNQASLNRVLLAEEKAWWVSWGLRCCQAGGTLMYHSEGATVADAAENDLASPSRVLDPRGAARFRRGSCAATPPMGTPACPPWGAQLWQSAVKPYLGGTVTVPHLTIPGSLGRFQSQQPSFPPGPSAEGWAGPAEGVYVSPTPRDAKGRLEDSRAGELATYVQENLEAAQLAGKLARQEIHGELALLREKSQALEVSVVQLAGRVKELSDRLPALSSRLDLQEQMLGLRLSEAKTKWEGAERKSLEDLARWQKEVAAYLRGVQEKLDGLPQKIEGVSDKCLLHKSDSDLRISAEGKAREFEVGALRQELATLLSSVQLLKEDSPGRKIAEMQGKLATFQNQIMKLESCIQANKTIQNLKFNSEARLRTQEMAALRETVLRLWSEKGPRAPLGSKALPSLARQRVFIKDVAPGEVAPVNCWGVYQAVRVFSRSVLCPPRGTPSLDLGPVPTQCALSFTSYTCRAAPPFPNEVPFRPGVHMHCGDLAHPRTGAIHM